MYVVCGSLGWEEFSTAVFNLRHCAVESIILCAQASEVQMSVVKFIALTSVNCSLLATMRLSLSIGIDYRRTDTAV